MPPGHEMVKVWATKTGPNWCKYKVAGMGPDGGRHRDSFAGRCGAPHVSRVAPAGQIQNTAEDAVITVLAAPVGTAACVLLVQATLWTTAATCSGLLGRDSFSHTGSPFLPQESRSSFPGTYWV